jgi:hypothetical protein
MAAHDPERSDGSPVTCRSIGGIRTFAYRNCLNRLLGAFSPGSAQDKEGADGGRVA